MGELVPRKVLVKQALKGVGGIGGGIALLALAGATGVFGFVIGGIVTFIGLAMGTSKEDRLAGAVTAGAGVLTLIKAANLPFLRSIAGGLMWAGGGVLIVAGVFSLINFIKNLNARR
jgi:hypothetical protein